MAYSDATDCAISPPPLCILNGRRSSENNSLTFVDPSKGRSVVDYLIVPYCNLKCVADFYVHLARELMTDCNVVGQTLTDHSLLEFIIKPHYFVQQNVDMNMSSTSSNYNCIDNNIDINRYYTRYVVSDISDQFLHSDVAQQAILHCIERIEQDLSDQHHIDDMYRDFCNVYYEEMDRTLRKKNVNPTAKKRLRHTLKPFWNTHLTKLWNDLSYKENLYLSARQNTLLRGMKRKQFLDAQHEFDRAYRREKRKFLQNKCVEIEKLNTSDPRAFWREIQKLGPKSSSSIPMAVYNEDGTVNYNERDVLDKWRNEFHTLYNNEAAPGVFDDEFYSNIMHEKGRLESENIASGDPISLHEVRKVVGKAKNKKAVGLDNIPNEVLKNDISLEFLHKLFQKIFSVNKIPTQWKLAIIKPIPKGAHIDPKLPMQYRGISLLSTVYKLYTGILNNRLLGFCEQNIYCDEQNGFRPNRSCTDHIYVLTSILRHRVSQNKSTYACFIDAEKAFDRVDRNLLLYKLLKYGINGNMYNNLRNIYSDSKSCVKVNGFLTDWIDIEYGVRQGDTLSPTLFGMYINDLIEDVKDLDLGIPIGTTKLSILVYADDVVILAENEEDLQTMLDVISQWGRKWRIKFNNRKSNVVHYRNKNTEPTISQFYLSNQLIERVKQYKYLGVILHEYVDFNVTAEVLAGAGSRALGSILHKYRKVKGLGYYTYSKLYQSCVCPVLDYASEIWGYKGFDKIDQVQNRAVRIYLGVHNFAPNLSIHGDMGWTESSVRRKVHMSRYWNRLVNLSDDRLTKRIFLWDVEQKSKGWASEMLGIFRAVDMLDVYNTLNECSTVKIWADLHNLKCQEWKDNLVKYPKLRTYITFKDNFCIEPYVQINMNRKYRSVLAQLRSGILPLEIECGRWKGLEVNERICRVCNQNVVEDEHHFVLDCPLYDDERSHYIEKLDKPDFQGLESKQKWQLIMSNEYVIETARFIWNIFQKRKSVLFT